MHELGVLHYLLGSNQFDGNILEDLESFKFLIDEMKAAFVNSESCHRASVDLLLIILFSIQENGFERSKEIHTQQFKS
ncbi:hypothetical protein KHA80_04020 [Anaerobacillus sp. HL2]|nr:hypothetical protein KHA80_04020 [Anaerobacillus sp. HL2]